MNGGNLPPDAIPEDVDGESFENDFADVAIEAIRYLRSGKGHEALMSVLTAQQLAKQADANFHHERLKAQTHLAGKQMVTSAWIYGTALVLIVGSLLLLSHTDKLTPASGTILGTLAGYILGGRSRQAPNAA